MLAIRQVTQLNAGKKTAGVDGIKELNFKQRFELETTLKENYRTWQHQSLREIPIPKKDGSKRLLKVSTIADRAWQCLLKYALLSSTRSPIPRKKLRIQTPEEAPMMLKKSCSLNSVVALTEKLRKFSKLT